MSAKAAGPLEERRLSTDAHDGIDGEARELARLLARGLTYTEAGEVLGMSKHSVFRRMRDPKMREAVDRARSVGVDGLLVRSVAEAEKSLAYLASVRDDDQQPTANRIRAAGLILARLRQGQPQEESMRPDEARRQLVQRLLELRDRAPAREQSEIVDAEIVAEEW
jgi:hypothetical protein